MAAVLMGDVLIIYTGGTIGSVPKDPKDPLSPLVPAQADDLVHFLPSYDPAGNRLLIRDKWIQLAFYAWSKPVDSSDISLEDWRHLARVIQENYDGFGGFVVLHGTDTMAYTASVLAFMLRNLDKPVVMTGSQLPIGSARTDAVQNLVTSIEIAAARRLGAPVVPEVVVFFRDRLYRGCRATKLNTSSFNAFASPNFPPLAEVGDRIRLQQVENSPELSSSQKPFGIVDTLEPNIASIVIFPGMSVNLLNNILETNELRGIVFQTFGTGNVPSSPEFLGAIDEAVRRGIILVDITQCRSGEVELGLYQVSSGLLSRQVISGLDMTPEAALGKLFVVLGSEREPMRAADRIQINTRGEQRQSIWNFHFGGGEIGSPGGTAAPALFMSTDQVGLRPADATLERGMILIYGFETGSNLAGAVELEVHADIVTGGRQDSIRLVSRSVEPSPRQCIVVPLEQALCKRLFEAHEIGISVTNRGLNAIRWEEIRISIYLASRFPVTEIW